jgi:CBS domain-containing protein
MDDVADFLSRHPPFDSLDEETLGGVAHSAEIESYPARAPILERADETLDFVYVVRRGSVELLSRGRLFDLAGEGEMFGVASLLAESPLGFVARAAENTVVYRIPERAIRPVLERPAAVRFVAASLTRPGRLLARPEPEPPPPPATGRTVSELIRGPALVCPPTTPVQEAARRMVETGRSAVVTDLGDGYGIVTDHDIRTRVVAAGAASDTPLSAVMTAPARTVAADSTASEAMVAMLDHGVRHLLVLEARRRLIGVIDDVDLMASERRAPFHLRTLVSRSRDAAGVAEAAADLPRTVIALHEAGLSALTICRMIASIHDTVTRRLLELAHEELGPPPVPYTWLALGSFGRREPFPGSDVDCALAWDAGLEPDPREPMLALARRVLDGLSASGLDPDQHGVVPSNPLFARSIAEWELAADRWLANPDRGRGLMLLEVLVESVEVWGATTATERFAAAFARVPRRDHTLRRLAVAALAERPPTGFFRQFVLESSGERKGTLDIKRGGLLPIESLARWAALAAGVSAASTPARLEAADAAGTLDGDDAAVLRDAFELVCALRMEHHVDRLRAGLPPDDLIDPKRLPPLTRTSLKEAFRAVARVQRGIALGLGLSGR